MQAGDAQKFAEQLGVTLFETSAKDNINVEEVSDVPTTDSLGILSSTVLRLEWHGYMCITSE